MRVRFIFYQLSAPAGIERSGICLANELAKSHDVEIFILRRGISAVFAPSFTNFKAYEGIIAISKRLFGRGAKKIDPLCEIVVGAWATSLWPILRFRRKKVIIWEHSVTRNRIKVNRSYSRIYRLCRRKYRRADLIVVNSHVTERCVLDAVGSSVPVSIIPNIVDEESSIKRASASDRSGRRLITIGALTSIKNPTVIPEVMRTLPEEFTLDVLGSGPLRKFVEASCRELGVENRVTFHGFVDDPTALLDTADILLHPSLSETFCLAAFEAAVRDIPVACVDVDALSEFVPDFVVGAKASNGSASELSRAIVRCEQFIGNPKIFNDARERRKSTMSSVTVVTLWNARIGELKFKNSNFS